MGWYLADEPALNHLPVFRLQQTYRLIKSLDRRPIVLNVANAQCTISESYWRAMDVLSMDHYLPFPGTLIGGTLREQRENFRRCVTLAHRHGKQPFIVVQAFGGSKDGRRRWRPPTAAEEQELTRLAIESGANGVLYWSDYRAGPIVRRNVARALRSYAGQP